MQDPDFSPPTELRAALLGHPLRGALGSALSWRIFMQHHVFAVWDFMCLVKRLQRELTCCEVPWLPAADPTASRFINSVVLAEESDLDPQGHATSHFELYLRAMAQAGADAGPARAFVARLREGAAPEVALRQAAAPAAARAFVAATLAVARDGALEEVCASFLWGREEIIPDLFAGLLTSLRASGRAAPHLEAYMDRHIALDGDEHGPMAARLLARVCGADAGARRRAEAAARAALAQRTRLWTAIHTAIVAARPAAERRGPAAVVGGRGDGAQVDKLAAAAGGGTMGG